jgi:hypothetical protein
MLNSEFYIFNFLFSSLFNSAFLILNFFNVRVRGCALLLLFSDLLLKLSE